MKSTSGRHSFCSACVDTKLLTNSMERDDVSADSLASNSTLNPKHSPPSPPYVMKQTVLPVRCFLQTIPPIVSPYQLANVTEPHACGLEIKDHLLLTRESCRTKCAAAFKLLTTINECPNYCNSTRKSRVNSCPLGGHHAAGINCPLEYISSDFFRTILLNGIVRACVRS